MKKLVLIMMAFMASFSIYAQEVNNKSEEVTAIEYSTQSFVIDISEVVYPYVINVEVPSETVLGVSGPTDPLLQTWRVENGRLIIELYEEDLYDVRAGNTHYIEVGMTNNAKMIIILIII